MVTSTIFYINIIYIYYIILYYIILYYVTSCYIIFICAEKYSIFTIYRRIYIYICISVILIQHVLPLATI